MPLSRRELIRCAGVTGIASLAAGVTFWPGRSGAAKEEPLGPLPGVAVGGFIRPPGALPERELRSKCISCGTCVNVCHVMGYDAIALAGLSGLWDFGTPYIKDMRDFPCGLCMECPGACPTGALRKVEKEKVVMGMALIDFGLCFGWNGDVCLSCSKACPLGAKVFDFFYGEWGNQPYINESCVGCGLCVKYCPLGGSAIKVVKKERYQDLRGSYLESFNALLAMPNEDRYQVVYGSNLPEIMARGRLIEREYR